MSKETPTITSLYGGGTHLVKFGSPTCGPCKVVAGIINKMEDDDRFSDVSFWDVNIADAANSELVRTLNIRSVPVVVLVKDGQNKKILIGGDISESKLEDNLIKLSE